jgi:Zn-dependent peptidase ImmA (M78 family)
VIYGQLSDTEIERDRIIERICDYFAGCLLVPRNWLKRAWSNGIQSPTALAALFNVSTAAIAVRLQQTGIVERSTVYDGELSQSSRKFFRSASLQEPIINCPVVA